MTDLKFAMLLALITSSKANPDDNENVVKETKVVESTFVQAIHYPELAMAMYCQLDPGFMDKDQQIFIGEVVYENNLFRLYGTYDQWRAFFSEQWELLRGWDGIVMSQS